MTWTCRGCKTRNTGRTQKCACGRKRPPRRKPSHMAALELPYEAYIELNGGEFCAICGCGRPARRRLDRDHDHRTGAPRGLLCHRHNRLLAKDWTPELLRAAADYLERSVRAEVLRTLVRESVYSQ